MAELHELSKRLQDLVDKLTVQTTDLQKTRELITTHTFRVDKLEDNIKRIREEIATILQQLDTSINDTI